MNIIKHILYASLLIGSYNAFGMENPTEKKTITDKENHIKIKNFNKNSAHNSTNKIATNKKTEINITPVEKSITHPKQFLLGKKVHYIAAKEAQLFLNSTLNNLNPEQHEIVKLYFDEQAKEHYLNSNSSEYKNLLAGKSNNPEIQKLLKIAVNTKRNTGKTSPTKTKITQTEEHSSALQAQVFLNFTLKYLNSEQHEIVKAYFDQETIKYAEEQKNQEISNFFLDQTALELYEKNNGSEYKNLLSGKSNNPEIQSLITEAANNYKLRKSQKNLLNK